MSVRAPEREPADWMNGWFLEMIGDIVGERFEAQNLFCYHSKERSDNTKEQMICILIHKYPVFCALIYMKMIINRTL